MSIVSPSLKTIFDGWDTYQVSIVHAVEPLSTEQLAYRPAAQLRSVGEIASHISLGRIGWFERMNAPRSKDLARKAAALESEVSISTSRAAILEWLEASWQMIDETLTNWTFADLARTYLHTCYGNIYRISFQWTIWRILAHDLHHGGELGLVLGMQRITVSELGDLGGHLTEPPLA
jgi:uncharacterized damage-inducible protein DinB